jgi:hypothetical protein
MRLHALFVVIAILLYIVKAQDDGRPPDGDINHNEFRAINGSGNNRKWPDAGVPPHKFVRKPSDSAFYA